MYLSHLLANAALLQEQGFTIAYSKCQQLAETARSPVMCEWRWDGLTHALGSFHFRSVCVWVVHVYCDVC